MTLTRAAEDDSILNIAISYLVQDLRAAAVQLFDEAAASDTRRERLLAADTVIRAPQV